MRPGDEDARTKPLIQWGLLGSFGREGAMTAQGLPMRQLNPRAARAAALVIMTGPLLGKAAAERAKSVARQRNFFH